MNGNVRVNTSEVTVDKQGRQDEEGAPPSVHQPSVHVGGTHPAATGPTSQDIPAFLACYQADGISNMAASSNAEQTHLQAMEEDDAEMEEREMESDEEEEEEGMGVENSDDDEEDESSEDEKENEAEIQRLEEQVDY